MQTISRKNSVKTFTHLSSALAFSTLLGFPHFAAATDVPNTTGDNSNPNVPSVKCYSTSINCVVEDTHSAFVTFDNSSGAINSLPFFAALPDDNPSGASNPASFYSFAKSANAQSVPPTVVCSTGTVASDTYRTKVMLADGDSCAITVTPQQNGDPYQHITYTGTLSRSGNIYSLTGGTICGTPYTACGGGGGGGPAPISASLLDFNPSSEVFSQEITVTE